MWQTPPDSSNSCSLNSSKLMSVFHEASRVKNETRRVSSRVMHIIRCETLGKTLGETLWREKSRQESYRDSRWDFSRQRVSQSVSPRVSDRIICMTLGEILSETRFFYMGSNYTFSIRFASGNCEGQSRISMTLCSFQELKSRLWCFESLFSWSIQSSPLLISCQCWADRIKAFWYIFNIFSRCRLSVQR